MVIEMKKGGKHVVFRNPNPVDLRNPKITAVIDPDELFECSIKSISPFQPPQLELNDIPISGERKKSHSSSFVRLEKEITESDLTLEATKAFDFKFKGRVTFDLPSFPSDDIPKDFLIGLICGPSGTGKTGILYDHYGKPFRFEKWNKDVPVSAHFKNDTHTKKIMECF
eukprot:UN34282